jgi:hypothetical protein
MRQDWKQHSGKRGMVGKTNGKYSGQPPQKMVGPACAAKVLTDAEGGDRGTAGGRDTGSSGSAAVAELGSSPAWIPAALLWRVWHEIVRCDSTPVLCRRLLGPGTISEWPAREPSPGLRYPTACNPVHCMPRASGISCNATFLDIAPLVS